MNDQYDIGGSNSDIMTKLMERVPKVIRKPIRIRHSRTFDEDVIISVDGSSRTSKSDDDKPKGTQEPVLLNQVIAEPDVNEVPRPMPQENYYYRPADETIGEPAEQPAEIVETQYYPAEIHIKKRPESIIDEDSQIKKQLEYEKMQQQMIADSMERRVDRHYDESPEPSNAAMRIFPSGINEDDDFNRQMRQMALDAN